MLMKRDYINSLLHHIPFLVAGVLALGLVPWLLLVMRLVLVLMPPLWMWFRM